MKIMKNRVRLLADRLGRKAELEIRESFLLQMNSGKEINVKGCQSVSLCTTEQILLQCRYGVIRINGMDLIIPVFSESETVVSGCIYDISFSWKG